MKLHRWLRAEISPSSIRDALDVIGCHKYLSRNHVSWLLGQGLHTADGRFAVQSSPSPAAGAQQRSAHEMASSSLHEMVSGHEPLPIWRRARVWGKQSWQHQALGVAWEKKKLFPRIIQQQTFGQKC